MTARAFGPMAVAAAGVATGRLGWRVADFWDATPVEWVTAVRGSIGEAQCAAPPLNAGDLARLMREIPDG